MAAKWRNRCAWMRPRPAPLSGGSHDLRHSGTAQRSERCEQANENGAFLDASRSLAEVRRDRIAYICREGHALGPASLAVHDDLAGAPPQVVETQGRHFGGAQAETGQRGDDRKVAAPAESPAVADGEQALDVVRLEARRQPRQSSTGYRRDGRSQ